MIVDLTVLLTYFKRISEMIGPLKVPYSEHKAVTLQ